MNYKRIFRDFCTDIVQFYTHLKWMNSLHPTMKAISGAALLVLLLSWVHFQSGLSLHFRLIEEDIRHWLWYLNSEEKVDLPISSVVLDLYTSETYNASENLYGNRYDAYQLPQNLRMFCQLGAKQVVLDTFIDADSWIGKHLASDKEASTQLFQALDCYQEIFIPIRDKNKETVVYPVSLFRDLEKKIHYTHVNTINSKLYRPWHSYQDDKMVVRFPYSALAIASNIDRSIHLDKSKYPHQLLPLQFTYHPLAFSRAGYKELSQLQEVFELLSSTEQVEIYKQYFENVSIPDLVLVGFTHDSADQHDMPYTKGGPIYLDPSSLQGEAKLSKFSQFGKKVQSEEQLGVEPPVFFTPGLYAVLSMANSLVRHQLPFYPVYNWPLLTMLIIGLIYWLSIEWGRNLDFSISRFYFFSFLAITYLSLYVAMFFYQIYIPLILPLFGFFSCMVCSELLYRQDVRRKLVKNSQFVENRGKSIQNTYNLADKFPIIIVQAKHTLAMQTSPLGELMSTMDIAETWIEILGLLQFSDYYYHQRSYALVPLEKWRFSLKRLSLGHYLGAFSQFGKNFASLEEAENSFFPMFYHLLVGVGKRKKKPFEANLEKLCALRNEWKHAKSTANPQHKIEQNIREIRAILEQIEKSLWFMQHYTLVKPLQIKEVSDQQQTWLCQCYVGANCFVSEIISSKPISAGGFYLFSHQRMGNLQGNILSVGPWIIGSECTYHHREELFFYSGVSKNFCNYSGLTKSCKPTEQHPFPKDGFQMHVG